jgi:hypothetical protein
MSISTRISRQPPDTSKWDALPLLVNDRDAARLLGVSVSFLRKSRCEGQIYDRTAAPLHVPVGGRRLYRVSDLRSWVENLAPREAIIGDDRNEREICDGPQGNA